jgi:hypothetical protein
VTLVVRQAMSDDDGTFTSGTGVGKTFVDQVYDQIDDQAHSTTNPTLKPKVITDEVVTARGSKAALGTRLDVALNSDGTLKALTDVSAVASGIVNLSAQTLGQGTKSVQAGASTGVLSLGGTRLIDTTQVANSGGSETDLATVSVLANTLDVNGRTIRVTVWGSFAANVNAKTVKLYFGATSITLASAGFNNVSWIIHAYLTRTGLTTQKMVGVLHTSPINAPVLGSPAETLSGAVTFKITGTGVASSDIVKENFIAEVMGP